MTGLFGDNDGNTTNDLKTADDTVIDGNASLSSIHYDFGSSCKFLLSFLLRCSSLHPAAFKIEFKVLCLCLTNTNKK